MFVESLDRIKPLVSQLKPTLREWVIASLPVGGLVDEKKKDKGALSFLGFPSSPVMALTAAGASVIGQAVLGSTVSASTAVATVVPATTTTATAAVGAVTAATASAAAVAAGTGRGGIFVSAASNRMSSYWNVISFP
jgi:hypothetical protein